MRPVRLFLGGEGSNDLGGWAGPASYRQLDRPGAVEALLRRIEPDGWEVCGALEWRRIRKYVTGGRGVHADIRNVIALTLHAKEAGADVVAFVRDRDGDRTRAEAVRRGVDTAPTEIRDAPVIVGGVAVPKLEGWVLALLGHGAPDALSSGGADKALAERGIAAKNGAQMVEAIAHADLDTAMTRSPSLGVWLGRAYDVLPALVTNLARPAW